MTSVTLIQCTNSKRDGPWKAEFLYDESGYFVDMREWARSLSEVRDQPWFILSAKHGLVKPDQIVSDYDERGLSVEQSESIAAELDRLGFDHVDVTAGMDYTDPLVPELEKRGIDVVNHFAGERIGTRRSLLQEATEELKHADL